MKKVITLCLFIRITFPCFAQTDKHADSLLANKQYFLLRDYADKNNHYYNAFLYNFFNNPAASNKEIATVFSSYGKQLTSQNRIALIKLQIDNDLKRYLYKEAYLNSTKLLRQYKKELPEDDAEDIANSLIIWKSLQAIPPQRTLIAKDIRINYKRDAASLITLPVDFDNYSDDYVFDTGANLSVITESNARKANLEMMADTFLVTAITGIKVKAQAGVARTFKIGDIIVHNAVFMIFPDSTLSFAGGQYKINGIIGFPIIEQLKEIRISQKGYIDVPLKPGHLSSANFGLDELTPVVNIGYKNTMHPFTFDTGAQITFFNEPFYTAYKAEIESAGKEQDMKVGGAGGSISVKSYLVPQLVLSLNGKTAILKNSSIKTTSSGENDKYYYGNLGQDVFSQYDELLINFKDMYVELIGLNQ
jgi:hypothetical protein